MTEPVLIPMHALLPRLLSVLALLLVLCCACRTPAPQGGAQDSRRDPGGVESRLAPRLLKDKDAVDRYVADFPRSRYKICSIEGIGKFHVDELDDTIKSQLCKAQIWEPQVLELLRMHIRPGSTVIDAGAHIGTHTVTMSRLAGPGGHVYAFEPQLKIFRELVHNLRLNRARNAVPLRFALGDKPGIIEMSPVVVQADGKRNEGGVSVGKGGDRAELRTIDSFGFHDVSLMKIDVEGFEDPVLDGSLATISHDHPAIIVEIMGGHGYEDAPLHIQRRIRRTILKLETLGYVVRRVDLHDYLALHEPDEKRQRAERRRVLDAARRALCRAPTCAKIEIFTTPGELSIGKRERFRMKITNLGSSTFNTAGKCPVRLSYHWLSSAGAMLVRDGLRTELPYYVTPEDSVALTAVVDPPREPGTYLLVFDLVKEGAYWFEHNGSNVLKFMVTVK